VEAPPTEAIVPKPLAVMRDVNDLHHMFGHAQFDAIKRSAKYYNIKLCGDVKTCVACTLAKIHHKNINKDMLSKSLKPGDCIYVDISGTVWHSYGVAKYWVLVVDDYSRYCWTYFFPDKAGLMFIMLIFMKFLEVTYNVCVNKMHLDNSGENIDIAVMTFIDESAVVINLGEL
jgi:hypothetical protein